MLSIHGNLNSSHHTYQAVTLLTGAQWHVLGITYLVRVYSRAELMQHVAVMSNALSVLPPSPAQASRMHVPQDSIQLPVCCFKSMNLKTMLKLICPKPNPTCCSTNT